VLLWDRVRGRADGRAALDVPVVAIDDDFGGIADEEEVPNVIVSILLVSECQKWISYQ
jgi:hypothetical protein